MPFIIPANTLASGGYGVANSYRGGTDDHYLVRDKVTPTAVVDFTFSVWVKRSKIADKSCIVSSWGGDTNNTGSIFFTDGDKLTFEGQTGGSYSANGGVRKITTQLFRDVSAWSHLVFQKDDGAFKIYHNGTEITAFDTNTQSSGTNIFNNASGNTTVGNENLAASDHDFQGYIAEAVFIDGQALAPTSFGEFDDSGIWKPIDVSGLTFGNNGFYLDFEDSSAMGNDATGGTDFTLQNVAAADQSTDTCTNNFCTWNSLDSFYSSATFSEGNTTVVTPNASLTYATATVGLSSGRWYFEVQPFDPSDNNNIGIVDHVSTSNSSDAGELQFQPRGWSYRQVGNVYNNNSSVSGSWDSYSAGVTIGVFVDLEDNKIYWSRNGVMQNSGTGVTITAAASTDTGFYFPAVGDYVTNDDTTFRTNFGGVSSFAISSGVTDDNGYGTFEYTPSVTVDSTAKKFYAICTKNLAEYG